MSLIFVLFLFFLYTCNVKGHMQKKPNGNLACLKMCHSTPSLADPEGAPVSPPPPPFFINCDLFHPILYQNAWNKAQIARENIKKPPELPGSLKRALDPCRKDFWLQALVKCVRSHNLLRPPKWKPRICPCTFNILMKTCAVYSAYLAASATMTWHADKMSRTWKRLDQVDRCHHSKAEHMTHLNVFSLQQKKGGAQSFWQSPADRKRHHRV